MTSTTPQLHPDNLELHYLHYSDKNVQNWLHFKHRHAFSEIFYISEGRGQFIIGEQTITVQENDIIYIPPQMEHTELSNLSTPLGYYVIGFSGFALEKDSGEPVPFLHVTDRQQELFFYFYQAFSENNLADQFSQAIISPLLLIILLQLERRQKVSFTPETSVKKETATILIKHFLDTHFKEELTLEELEKHFHINKYYLSHRFKEDYGISPIKYLNQVRLEKVKDLLEKSNYTITEITNLLNFSSQSYLSQVFKKYTGLSPAQFRKNQRQSEAVN